MSRYYDLCCQHKGKVVTIYERTGKVHVGKIVDVDQQYVYIQPETRGVRGFGYGYYGYPGYYPYPYPYYPVWPVALAAIGGFVLGAALFWI
ncbi:hypothetical protein BKP45_16100 [Anaerobacillus alkalidiazotrophicus]|uniref:Uncharacterized protein n=1 Tax=Anaerobacillus alkalidiazotrophicus TaxID=472963 RepID=A0A1S2M1N7_9BACI|nr:hypothetical protein [Anaerobacillus alkalidiazotrophicus]OIJ18652.1 hypothetical protein BKP45_16100 [Anaerobacillus alkalidiazotrophicus]